MRLITNGGGVSLTTGWVVNDGINNQFLHSLLFGW